MTNKDTTHTSGAADLPEAPRSIQRFEVVDCIDEKHVPAVIPKPHGPWVRYEDHIAALAAGQATAAPAGGVVAYLDIGAGGYLDLGSDLSNEAISRLPKGRHALIVAGTYGIDGYTHTPPAQAAAQQGADSAQEDAALWHWLAEYLVGTRTDLDDEIVASETVNDLRKLVEAAIKQGVRDA